VLSEETQKPAAGTPLPLPDALTPLRRELAVAMEEANQAEAASPQVAPEIARAELRGRLAPLLADRRAALDAALEDERAKAASSIQAAERAAAAMAQQAAMRSERMRQAAAEPLVLGTAAALTSGWTPPSTPAIAEPEAALDDVVDEVEIVDEIEIVDEVEIHDEVEPEPQVETRDEMEPEHQVDLESDEVSEAVAESEPMVETFEPEPEPEPEAEIEALAPIDDIEPEEIHAEPILDDVEAELVDDDLVADEHDELDESMMWAGPLPLDIEPIEPVDIEPVELEPGDEIWARTTSPGYLPIIQGPPQQNTTVVIDAETFARVFASVIGEIVDQRAWPAPTQQPVIVQTAPPVPKQSYTRWTDIFLILGAVVIALIVLAAWLA
jgi:hypothetical protein